MNPQSGGAGNAPPDKEMCIDQTQEKDVQVTKIIKTNKYRINSIGPFAVVIQGSREQNIGNYHPMAIAKELMSLNIQHKKGPLRKGKNRITIEFDSPQAANAFVENKILRDKGYEIFIPNANISCKGVVRGIYKSLTIEEIKNNSKSFVDILDVIRLKRKVIVDNKIEYVETGSCLFTFEGKIIPRAVSIYGLDMRTEPYIMRVTQCYNCLLYGHTKKQCRGRLKCQTCAKVHEGACSNKINCHHCNSSTHISTDRNNCPEYERQKQIRFYMSTNSISFYEASELVPPIQRKPPGRGEQDFPTLQSKTQMNNANSLGLIQDRNYTKRAIEKNEMPSYSTVTTNKRKKTRSPSPQPGYNREMYESCLITPEARTRFSPMPRINKPAVAQASQLTLQDRRSAQSASETLKQLGITEGIQLSEMQIRLVNRYISNLITLSTEEEI